MLPLGMYTDLVEVHRGEHRVGLAMRPRGERHSHTLPLANLQPRDLEDLRVHGELHPLDGVRRGDVTQREHEREVELGFNDEALREIRGRLL